MRKFDLVILDWNGTIQDDLHYIYECGVQRIFRHFGLSCPTLEEYRHEVTADFMNSIYWPRGVPKDVDAAALNAIMAEGFKLKAAPPGLFDDADRFVKGLALRGHKQAVSSGYAQAKLDAAVGRSGFGSFFLCVEGDVRDKVASFKGIIERFGVPASRTAVVGDTTEDILGAVGAGATPFICSRGFHPVDKLESTREQAPSLVIRDTLLDLLPYFP